MTLETPDATQSEYAIPIDQAGTRRSMFRWIILALLGTISMLVNADQANLGIALPALKTEFGISNAEAALFPMLMLCCFAAMQIPAGLACRRFGPRHLMMVALAVTAVASYFTGTSRNALDVMIYRSVQGLAEASVSVCCMTVINHWFSVRDRGTATGFFWGASKVGPVLSPPMAALILQCLGWRSIFQLFAFPVLLAFCMWFFLVQNRPEQSKYVSHNELEKIRNPEPAVVNTSRRRAAHVPDWVDRAIRRKPIHPVDTIGGVFRSWNLMGNMLANAFMVGVFFVFVAWLPSYLVNGKHLSLTAAGILSSTMFAGAVSGNVIGGWVSDNLLGGRRKPLMMLGALLSSIALVGLIFSPANELLVGSLLLLTGIVVGLGYSLFFVYTMSVTSREMYPLAFGVLNTGGILGAGLFQIITGVILDRYTWDVVLGFLAISALVCVIFLVTVEEPVEQRQ